MNFRYILAILLATTITFNTTYALSDIERSSTIPTKEATFVLKNYSPKVLESLEKIKEKNKELYQSFSMTLKDPKRYKLLKAVRAGYNKDIKEQIVPLVTSMKKATKKLAMKVYTLRRVIGEKYKNLTPKKNRKVIYKRNIRKYGDALGPKFPALMKYQMGKGLNETEAYEQIIRSSIRPNLTINNFFGL
jgi:hypothetical protein